MKEFKLHKDALKEHHCIHCGTKRDYSEKYDSYYCSKCNHWLNIICPDRKCEFCKDRPRYPEEDKEKKE